MKRNKMLEYVKTLRDLTEGNQIKWYFLGAYADQQRFNHDLQLNHREIVFSQSFFYKEDETVVALLHERLKIPGRFRPSEEISIVMRMSNDLPFYELREFSPFTECFDNPINEFSIQMQLKSLQRTIEHSFARRRVDKSIYTNKLIQYMDRVIASSKTHQS